ncbi:MAG TPA: hypothetical protein VGV38_08450 [Pyrinomonadaceae bacterium]|nr:hypothetical protein [Pyrinomonadaceae bacterium]
MLIRVFVTSVVTALIMLALGVFGFFTLLLGMNGVHESKATPIFVGYVVLAVLVVVGFALLSGWGVKAFSTLTGWPAWAATPLLVVAASALGGVALFVCMTVVIIALGVK